MPPLTRGYVTKKERKMRIALYFVPLMLIVGLFQGCALVRSDVAVFHQLPEVPVHTKYAFIPLKGQESSLEYATYQKLIRAELAAHKYEEVDTADAEVIVAFSYGIDSGKEKLSSVPIFGQTGVSSLSTYGTISTYGNYGSYSGTTTYTPTYGVVGSSTVSGTQYGRGLWLYIVDKKTVGTEKLKMLYEGSVKSSGSSSQISKVMPAMVKALFKEFPGKSGSTRREIIPLQ